MGEGGYRKNDNSHMYATLLVPAANRNDASQVPTLAGEPAMDGEKRE